MPSTLYICLLSAAMLAALPLRSPAAPVPLELTDSPAGDTSGEEEEGEVTPTPQALDLLSTSQIWKPLIGTTEQHRKQFEDEFRGAVHYYSLDDYRVSSLPTKRPDSNFSMDACLRWLAEGLQTYMVLFKHVEREYPDSVIVPVVRDFSGRLIREIKAKMRHPEKIRALTSSQEAQLLECVTSPDTFRRKMTAHSILRQLHDFLRNAKASISRKELLRVRAASRVTTQ